jgi:hypothetical protein
LSLLLALADAPAGTIRVYSVSAQDAASLTQTLSPARLDNSNTFYSATVSTGAVALTPALFTNTQTFYTHNLVQAGGAQTLLPPLVSNTPFSPRPALLLHMDGTDGSSVVVDDSSYGASITTIAGTLTTSDKKFGTASLNMTRGLTVNGDIERFKFTGDYTIAMQIKVSAWGNRAFFTLTDSPGFAQYVFGMNASGGLQLSSAYVSSSTSQTANGIVPLDEWAHVQIARSGTTTRIWLEGAIVSTFSESGSYASGGLAVARVQIGEYVSNEPFIGLMDEVLVLSGEAANTSAFTPPTSAYSYTATNFPTHSIALGAVTLSPALFTNSNTFYSHTLTASFPSQTLTASLFTNSNAFYSATLTRGAVTLSPARFDNTNTFYSHSISAGSTLLPSLFTNSNTFYSASLSTLSPLLPSLFTNGNEFYNHSISGSTVSLLPSLYTNTSTFYGAIVYTAAIASDYNVNRVVYVPLEASASGAAVSVSRTVYVPLEASATGATALLSRVVYVPSDADATV